MQPFFKTLSTLIILSLAACANSKSETNMHNDLSGEYVVSSIAGTTPEPQPNAVINKTDADYIISGNSGCNSYHASLKLIGSNIEISNAATTRMLCDPASMQVEQQFLDALNNAKSWQQTANGISLGDLELSRNQ